MIEKVTCQFCASRCGMLINLEDGKPSKVRSAPCENACPAGIDIPRYIRFIATRNYSEAIQVIREKAPLPAVLGSVCHHPCEAICRRGEADESLSIKALKGFAAEYSLCNGPRDGRSAGPTGKRVAVIGSGPAGLTCGYYLVRAGHTVTLFEELPAPGGMMRVGIPAYRLPREILDREIAAIEASGVTIVTNHRVDSIDELFSQGYDAVFVGTGAHRGINLNIDGEKSPGIIDCLSFLRRVNFGEKMELGHAVAVLGGGYGAIDAARTARRLGVQDVKIIYRRTRHEMKASHAEIDRALAEGVGIQILSAPNKLSISQGKLALECVEQRLGSVDASGRRRPEAVEGSTFILQFDSIISAIGQLPDIPAGFALASGSDNTLLIDPGSFQTSREGVFAGGDVVTGPASVIEAIGAGRKAALAIDGYLGGVGDREDLLPVSQWVDAQAIGNVAGLTNRLPMEILAAGESTTNFANGEIGFDERYAIEEANRCLWCDLADGDPDHPLSQGWSCKRGRADTARRFMRFHSF